VDDDGERLRAGNCIPIQTGGSCLRQGRVQRGRAAAVTSEKYREEPGRTSITGDHLSKLKAG
jgi:hypothetical protein